MVVGDKVNLNVIPKLSVGIGTTSTSVAVKWDDNINHITINPRIIDASKINTTSNQLEILRHNLNTGDRVSYSSTLPISGLSTNTYYTFKVDDNNIKLCDTLIDSNANPPTVVSFASTGGQSHTITPINPRITVTQGTNLVFDLSDSSLSGHYLKIYHDNKFNNEFVSTGTTEGFTITGIDTTGGVVGALSLIHI